MQKIYLLIIIIIVFVNTVFAQQTPDKTNEEMVFSDSTEVVLLDVAVVDKNGNFIPELTKMDFQVYEDKKEQKLDFFSQENVPISFGLVIDTSGSMRFKLPMVLAAAKEMLKFCRAEDEVFIINMKDDQNIKIVQPFTQNFVEASKVVDKFLPGGGTALLDGIAQANQYAELNAKNRRQALIIMSDGDDRSSTIEKDQLINQLRTTNTQVYLLGFPEGFVTNDGKFIDYTLPKAKKLLNKIAEESGGETFFPTSLAEILPILKKVCSDVRAQYTIGYYPAKSNDSRWHTIEVKLTNKKFKYIVRTRPGYFANRKKGASPKN